MSNPKNGFIPIIILVLILAGIVLIAPLPYYQPKTKVRCGYVDKNNPPCLVNAGWQLGSPIWTKVLSVFSQQITAKKVEKSVEFRAVTIKQLIENRDEFDDKKVLIKGKYQQGPQYLVRCLQLNHSKTVLKKEYRTFPSIWEISEGTDVLGIDVVNKNGTHISVYPNYKDGEEISLAGIARTTTTSDECPSGIRYESIYLEVREEDVNLTLKPLPITTPPLKSENCDALIGQKEDGNFVKGEIMVGFKDNVSINDAQEIIYSLGLNAKNNTSYNTSKFLLVKVPEGTELKWVCVFKQNQLVRDSGKIEFTEVNNKIQVPDCSKGPC